jgi:hypothetical protein
MTCPNGTANVSFLTDLTGRACKYKGKGRQTALADYYKTLIGRLPVNIFPLPLPPLI